jgi:flavin reductase (DIM6/NTAB) family NADH-FMN oxidoreductase RutF
MSQVTVAASPVAGFVEATRHFVTGVVVVTAGPPDRARGVTVSTLTLASYRPPVVSLVLRAGAQSVAALQREGGFAVSVLAADQTRLARYFADTRRPAGMAGLADDDWQAGQWGPLLRGAICWLECELEQAIVTGDHQLLLGRVRSSSLRPGRPLVNFAGELHPDVFRNLEQGGSRDD